MNFLIVSGYLVQEIEISKGKDRSEVAFVTKRIHRGRTMLQRFEKSISLLIKKSAGERTFFSSPGWRTYMVSRKVRPDVERLVLGFRLTPESEEDQLKISNIHIFVSNEPL